MILMFAQLAREPQTQFLVLEETTAFTEESTVRSLYRFPRYQLRHREVQQEWWDVCLPLKMQILSLAASQQLRGPCTARVTEKCGHQIIF